MGLRFRKSIKIIPGVRLNVGLRRASLSVGGRGLTYNIGSKGSRVTVGIPGSGLSYSSSVAHQSPASLLANSMPARRRYSATPFVIAAFLLALVYIAIHSTSQNNAAQKAPESEAQPGQADITGSVARSFDEGGSVSSGPVPLPRPRPKVRIDLIGPPLQIRPQE